MTYEDGRFARFSRPMPREKRQKPIKPPPRTSLGKIGNLEICLEAVPNSPITEFFLETKEPKRTIHLQVVKMKGGKLTFGNVVKNIEYIPLIKGLCLQKLEMILKKHLPGIVGTPIEIHWGMYALDVKGLRMTLIICERGAYFELP